MNFEFDAIDLADVLDAFDAAAIASAESKYPALKKVKCPKGMSWLQCGLELAAQGRAIPRLIASGMRHLGLQVPVSGVPTSTAGDSVDAVPTSTSTAGDSVDAVPTSTSTSTSTVEATGSYRKIDMILGEFSPSSLVDPAAAAAARRRENALSVLRSLIWSERVKPTLFVKGLQAGAYRPDPDWPYYDSDGSPIPDPDRRKTKKQRQIRWDGESVAVYYKAQWDLFAEKWFEATSSLTSEAEVFDWAQVAWGIGSNRLSYLIEKRSEELFNR